MTPERIAELAREAGIEFVLQWDDDGDHSILRPCLAAFAAAVRREALEDAAKAAERTYIKSAVLFELGTACVASIRAL
jgi:hypothetical protein